jgi:hypothetical protein
MAAGKRLHSHSSAGYEARPDGEPDEAPVCKGVTGGEDEEDPRCSRLSGNMRTLNLNIYGIQ